MTDKTVSVTPEPKIAVFACETIGVSGTTPAHVRANADGTFEARMGFALMGMTNMDDAGFARCDHNPFHEKFYDNFASGVGPTQEAAIEQMKASLRDVSRSL